MLALIAMLSHAALAIVHGVVPQALAGSERSAAIEAFSVVCTAAGITALPGDPARPSSAPGNACPVCHLLSGPCGLPAGGVAVTVARRRPSRVVAGRAQTSNHQQRTSTRNRGPPRSFGR